MKKLLYIVLILLSIIGNLFAYSFVNNILVDSFVFTKTKVLLDYKSDVKIDSQEFIDNMVRFSNDNGVNISQYNFMDEEKLNIYSTNIEADSKIHLEEGEFPYGNLYISNEDMTEGNKRQIGKISFPSSNWKVNIYRYEQVKNVGIGNELYFTNPDQSILEKFIEEFSYCAVISIESPNSYWYSSINKSLFIMFLFFLSITFISLTCYFIQYRKEMILKKIWGYSEIKISFSLLKDLLIFWALISFFIFIALIITFILLNKTWFIGVFLIAFFVTNISLAIIVLVFGLLTNRMVRFKNEDFENIKNKKPLIKIQIGFIILKGISCLMLFFILSNFLIDYNNLKIKMDNLKYWEKTENIYKIVIGSLFDETLNDLKKDRDYNERAFKFYNEFGKEFGAFIIESDNFGYENLNGGSPKYFYEMDTRGDEQIYYPEGRRILVDYNYLKLNPIISAANNIPVENEIDFDNDTLNILVPEQYKKYESKIDSLYKQWFYFYKVEVENIYNKELEKPLNNQTLETLKVNFIYTEKGQSYFTFNSYTGDDTNQVKDPIAIVFNGDSIDTSYIGALMTRAVYFEDYSHGNAYNNIKPLINKNQIQEIDRVESVYSEANNQIARLKESLFQSIMGLCIASVFSVFFLMTIIWIYYSSNIYELNLKYIFGYSYWQKNKEIILSTAVIYIITSLLVIFKYTSLISITIPAIFITFILDLFLINQIINHFNMRDMNKLLKGDQL